MRNIGDRFLSSFGVQGDLHFFLDNTLKIAAVALAQEYKERATLDQRQQIGFDVEDLANEIHFLREDIKTGDRDHKTMQQLREASIAMVQARKTLKKLSTEPEEGNDVSKYAHFLRKRVFNIGSYFEKILRIIKNA